MKEYPYIFYPISIPKSENLIPSRNRKEGLSENFFERKFLQYFKNYVLKNVIIEDERSHAYNPDYVLFIPEYNLYIDIEIDEPYTLKGNIPIHNEETNDEVRNQYFLNRGWGIIRFAEAQVIKFPQLCCKIISEYIRNLTGDNVWLEGFQELEDLEILKAWTKEETLIMIENSFRKTYFNFLKTIKLAEPSINILVDGIYLNNEIRDTVNILKNEKTIKSFNKYVKNTLFLKLLSGFFEHFDTSKTFNGKIFIELTIFISNHHSIESFSFDSDLIEIENYVINVYYLRTHEFIYFTISDKIEKEKLKQVMLIADDQAYPLLLEPLVDTKFILVRNYYNTKMSPYIKYASMNYIIEQSLQIEYI